MDDASENKGASENKDVVENRWRVGKWMRVGNRFIRKQMVQRQIDGATENRWCNGKQMVQWKVDSASENRMQPN